MCGIAGFSGKFEADLLGRMSASIAHRRLAIIDLSSAGHQPMTDINKRAVIVYNGEIYNYRELREELTEKGCRFCGHDLHP